MLRSLSLEDLALVESVTLAFAGGLNVLTGETGAGKSLVVGSVGLLLGERADATWLRAGAKRASVEGVFDLTGRDDLARALEALDVETEEGCVVLRREIAADGRSRAFVNGRGVLLGQLRAVGELLVDLHGQHEHQQLLRTERQTDFFDAWAGLHLERRSLETERDALLASRRALEERRIAFERDRDEEAALREDLAELEAAAGDFDREEELRRERDRLAHRERLLIGMGEALHALADDEDGAEARLHRASKALRAAAALDPGLAPVLDDADAAAEALAALTTRLEGERGRLAEEPLDLDDVESRLDRLRRLERKHRTDVAGLSAAHASLRERVSMLDPDGRGLAALEREHTERQDAFERRLDAFVAHRAERYAPFAREVGARLERLGFGKAALGVGPVEADRSRAAIDPVPIPALEFAFQPNPGEPSRPLRRIASGGELSRVMLAVKSLMAERDQVAVLVFDEVDQGIGGAVGEEVGRLLRAIGDRRQVLCITHLPLIAAYGARHFVVAKGLRAGRTSTTVAPLEGADREAELARLLAGARVSETTLRQARELLRAASERSAIAEEPVAAAPRRKRAAKGGR
ncbi:MAG: DNA repair protein RecN [Hyphomicrobiales bacterium]